MTTQTNGIELILCGRTHLYPKNSKRRIYRTHPGDTWTKDYPAMLKHYSALCSGSAKVLGFKIHHLSSCR